MVFSTERLKGQTKQKCNAYTQENAFGATSALALQCKHNLSSVFARPPSFFPFRAAQHQHCHNFIFSTFLYSTATADHATIAQHAFVVAVHLCLPFSMPITTMTSWFASEYELWTAHTVCPHKHDFLLHECP